MNFCSTLYDCKTRTESRNLKFNLFTCMTSWFFLCDQVSVLPLKHMVKAQVWTLDIAPLTQVWLATSSALQSRKWQLIGMSQWCRSTLCGHPLPALTDNSRHTIAPISHTRPSPCSRSYYSFPVPLRVGGWVGLSTHKLATCSRLLAVDRVWVELATSQLRVQYSTTTPLHTWFLHAYSIFWRFPSISFLQWINQQQLK